jgi:hypothetical protein
VGLDSPHPLQEFRQISVLIGDQGHRLMWFCAVEFVRDLLGIAPALPSVRQALARCDQLSTVDGLDGPVTSLSLVPVDGRCLLVIGTIGGTVTLWDASAAVR